MASAEGSTPNPTPDRFAHFMIRLRRRASDAEAISGLVELLGSGEKEPFDTADDLLRLLTSWPSEVS